MKKYINNEIAVYAIAISIVVIILALFVWIIYPELQSWLGVQSTVDNIDESSIPNVGASPQASVIPAILTFGVAFFLLKTIFTPKAMAPKSSPAIDQVTANYLQ